MPEKINFDKIIESNKSKLDPIQLPLEQMVTNYERKCLASMALWCCTPSNGFLEFGTWRGLTTSYLARVMSNVPIYTVNIDSTDKKDINQHQPNELLPHDEIGMECKHYPNVRIIYKDSLTLDLEKEGIKNLGMVFVDGAHDYKHVLRDFQLARDHSEESAIIAFHNYNPNHVAKKETVDDYVEGGICLLVQENPQLEWYHIENTCIVYFSKDYNGNA